MPVAVALSVSACAAGGSGSSHSIPPQTSSGTGTGTRSPAGARGPFYDDGLSRIINPSAAAGGTLTLDLGGAPDSVDYQDTSYAFMWDFVRLYSMQLMTFKSCPGACGLQLVPDLATGPGRVSDHGLVWTYRIQPDVKFENGRLVTAADVKYGIERTYARAVLPYGPNYYRLLLTDSGYGGPYADPGAPLTSITTPDPTTIQFHLAAPFPDFNYVVANPQSTPVLASWDAGQHGGADFQLDPISTGPYEIRTYTPGKRLVLVKNPYWNPVTDPQARQLASTIVVNMNLGQTAVDSGLLAGAAVLDLSGSGLQPAAAAKVLSTPALKADADNPVTGLLHFAYINVTVIPDEHCRAAIEYAADKTTMQTAYGGPVMGNIASTVLPPDIAGYRGFDVYQALTRPGGDDAAARAQLRQCGQAGGFSTGLAYRIDQPGDAEAARALQASLAAVGIRAHLDGYSSAAYYTSLAGYPSFARSHDLGISIGAWRAQWPDGYGFLHELSDGSTIGYGGGNTNISQINDPVINSMFGRAAGDDGEPARDAIWPEIDSRIMGLAAILPIVDQKVLLYRNPHVTNVYVDDAYGMYNYAMLGLR